MSDIRCAVCREPWDECGAREGDMAPWEYNLFRQGAGCPSCEGDRPSDVDPDDALVDHLASVVFDGSEDPDSYARLHDPDGKRPAWERPEDPVVFECAGCDSRLLGNVDFSPKSEHYRYWHTPTVDRYYHRRPGGYNWPTDDSEIREIDGKRYCRACADACGECGEPIFLSDSSCTGTVLYGDTYDPGSSFADPRSCYAPGICVGCFEAIPTCAYCSSVIEEGEEIDDNGYGECCATSSAPAQCEEEPEGGGDYCDSTRFDWDSDKKAWVCCHCDREHPRDSRFE